MPVGPITKFQVKKLKNVHFKTLYKDGDNNNLLHVDCLENKRKQRKLLISSKCVGIVHNECQGSF